MHMIGAGGSTVLQYMGYFTGKLVDDSDAHLVYGNIYIICLGISYITSWMRHKNRWISMIVESTHSICGYCCFLLAREIHEINLKYIFLLIICYELSYKEECCFLYSCLCYQCKAAG